MTAPLPPHEVLGAATVQHLAALPPADALYAQVVRDRRPLPQAVIDVLEPVARQLGDPARGAPPEALALARAALAVGFRFGTALLPDGDGDLVAATAQVGRVRLFDLPVPLRQRFLPFAVPDRAAHDSAWFGWYAGYALAVARSTSGDHHVVRLRWAPDRAQQRRAVRVHERVTGARRELLVGAAAYGVLLVATLSVQPGLGFAVVVLGTAPGVLLGRARERLVAGAPLGAGSPLEGQADEFGLLRFSLPEPVRLPWSAVRYAARTPDGLVLGIRREDPPRLAVLALPLTATSPGGWARLEELVRAHVRPFRGAAALAEGDLPAQQP